MQGGVPFRGPPCDETRWGYLYKDFGNSEGFLVRIKCGLSCILASEALSRSFEDCVHKVSGLKEDFWGTFCSREVFNSGCKCKCYGFAWNVQFLTSMKRGSCCGRFCTVEWAQWGEGVMLGTEGSRCLWCLHGVHVVILLSLHWRLLCWTKARSLGAHKYIPNVWALSPFYFFALFLCIILARMGFPQGCNTLFFFSHPVFCPASQSMGWCSDGGSSAK